MRNALNLVAAAGQSQSGKKRGPVTLRNFAIAGLAVVCGPFFLLVGRPSTQPSPRFTQVPQHHEELGTQLDSRHLAVRTSTQ